jgi:hypothetical protein
MLRNVFYLLLFFTTIGIIACTKDEDEILESGSLPLQASQVMPATGSNATGVVTVKLNKGTKVMNYTISWADLSGEHEGIKFHIGARKVNGPIVKTVATNGAATGSITETWNVPDSLVNRIEQGLLYIDVQTTNFPNGEIRGQIEF